MNSNVLKLCLVSSVALWSFGVAAQQLPFPYNAVPSGADPSNPIQSPPVIGSQSEGGMPRLLGGAVSGSQRNTLQSPVQVEQQLPDVPLPKRPVSPFQKYVFETIGRMLPVYGESAFQRSLKRDFTNSPVSLDYEIGPGDQVFINIWGGVDISLQAQVDRDGQITIPSVGTFPVAGVKARDLDSYLSGQVGKYFKNFSLSASLGKLGGLNIYVAGQALVPGVHQVSSASTLASVLFTVAQPGMNGSLRNVLLKRGGQTVASFDLYDLLKNGSLKGDRKLQSGDVVLIGQAGNRVALNTEGPSAAVFEMKPGETLQDILQIAGLDQTLVRQDHVLVEGFNAQNPKAPRQVEQIAYSRALTEVKLRDGDIVSLFQAQRDFSNAVTLKGAVADPARYPFVPGMTIADLIPAAESLIQPEYFKKKSALVGVYKEKADQAEEGSLMLEEFGSEKKFSRNGERISNKHEINIQDRSNTNHQYGSKELTGKLEAVEESIKNLLPQINWDYAVVERLNRTELQPVLIPFNLRKAMARDPQANLVLQAGDVVTIFSAEDGDIPKSRRTALVKVTGEVAAPGYYQVSPGETVRDVLAKAGGITEGAYLYGTKLTRKAIMKQQEEQFKKALEQAERLLLAATNKNAASALNPAEASSVQTQAASQRQYLEKLRATKPDGRVVLDIEPTAKSIAEVPALALEDGDSIVVPAMPGQVAIFGSVYSQGAFAFKKGQSVFDYLSMAGGAAKSSDKGSIFVLRANGTVDSAQQGWIPFINGLTGARALPGDAIYVPEDFERVSFMKGLLDISQIFYQVGLGAAAIKAIQD